MLGDLFLCQMQRGRGHHQGKAQHKGKHGKSPAHDRSAGSGRAHYNGKTDKGQSNSQRHAADKGKGKMGNSSRSSAASSSSRGRQQSATKAETNINRGRSRSNRRKKTKRKQHQDYSFEEDEEYDSWEQPQWDSDEEEDWWEDEGEEDEEEDDDDDDDDESYATARQPKAKGGSNAARNVSPDRSVNRREGEKVVNQLLRKGGELAIRGPVKEDDVDMELFTPESAVIEGIIPGPKRQRRGPMGGGRSSFSFGGSPFGGLFDSFF